MNSPNDGSHTVKPGGLEFSDDLDGSDVSTEVVASASIAVVSGSSAGRAFALIGRETVIGRAPDAHIRLDDKAISGHHSKIVRQGDLHALVDLGSTNGTFLNGRRLLPNQPVVLTHGDNIQVAETLLAYVPNQHGQQEQTHYLAKVAPAPHTLALSAPTAEIAGNRDMQVLAQLLASSLPAPEPPPPTLEDRIDSVLRLVAIVRRNWIPLFAATAFCALVGNASVFVKPPPSEASVIVRLTPKPSENPMERGEWHPEGQGVEFFTSAQESFTAGPLVESTLKKLGEKPLTPALVNATVTNLKFDSIAQQTYMGTFKHRSPDYSVNFLTRHVQNFLDTEIQKTLHVIQAQVDFLSQRIKEREEELRKTEDQLKEFKDKHIEGLPENAQGHFATRETLYTRRAELIATSERTNLELKLARQRLKEEAPLLTSRVENAQPYETALVEARRRLADAQARGLGEQHPEVISTRDQISKYEKLAQEARNRQGTALDKAANPALIAERRRVDELEVLARSTGTELGQVNAQLQRLDSIVNKMPEVEARYAQLSRSYAANKEQHTKLFEQLRTSQLQLELERTSAKARYEVLSPPKSSGVPLRKALLIHTLVGAILGLLIGAIIVAVRELKRYLAARRTQRALGHMGGNRNVLVRN